MVNNKYKTASFLILLQLAAPLAHGAATMEKKSFEAKTFGKMSGATVAAGNPSGTNDFQTATDLKVIGKSLNALTTKVESPDDMTIGGVTYTTVYSFGKRVFADAWSISTSGPNNVRMGLAPTEVRLTFVKYPVGPLILNVAGGTRFQALLDATLVPEVALPINDSTLGVNMLALAQGAGFVEGYASILVLRAGVGGQVDLMDGQLNVNGRVAFNGKDKPIVLVGGIVHFFKGRIYAFLDLFAFLRMGWTRLINQDLYTWQGLCLSMGHLSCPAK